MKLFGVVEEAVNHEDEDGAREEATLNNAIADKINEDACTIKASHASSVLVE